MGFLYKLERKTLKNLRACKAKRIRQKLWDHKIKIRKDNMSGKVQLSDEQKKQIHDFWDRYIEIDDTLHTYYLEKTGKFYPDLMPDPIYYCYVNPYFDDVAKAQTYENKCLYNQLFPNSRQARVVASRVNKIWRDSNYQPIPFECVKKKASDLGCVVVKQAQKTWGGYGVAFAEGDTLIADLEKYADTIDEDMIIQEPLSQHEDISKIGSKSINSIRMISVLYPEEVKVYAPVMRIGVGDSRTDNTSSGGISCGIDETGRLMPVAYNDEGECFHEHPTSHVKFEEIVVPNFDKVKEFVRNAHGATPYFRMISWDIAVEADGLPTLIEANLQSGGLDLHQYNHGSAFGEDTERIMDEVFGKKH